MSNFKVGDKVIVYKYTTSSFYKKGDVGIVVLQEQDDITVDFSNCGNIKVHTHGCWLVWNRNIKLVDNHQGTTIDLGN